MTTTKQTKLEALRVKRDKLTAEGFKLRDKIHAMQQQVNKLSVQIQREEMRQQIGKPVRINFRHRASDPREWMNTAVGTLVAVRISKCVVEYAEHGTWRFNIDDIDAVSEGGE